MKMFLKSKLIFGFVVVAMLTAVAGVLGVPSSARASTTITVRGTVSCANHQFVNIWINSTGGGSGFYWFDDNVTDNRGGIFYATVNTNFPTTISLHVGCGGYTWNWDSDNWTPGFTLNSPQDNPPAWTTSCNEGSMVPHTAQRCSWGGSAADRYAAWFGWIHLNGNGNQYVGECLTYAFDAYRSNGVAIDKYWTGSHPAGRVPYPEDVWPNITRGFVGTSQPPPYGALVFFLVPTKSATSYQYSHVGISNGDGTFFSTDDTYGEKVLHTTNVHVETIAEHNYYSFGKYVGWWLPA